MISLLHFVYLIICLLLNNKNVHVVASPISKLQTSIERSSFHPLICQAEDDFNNFPSQEDLLVPVADDDDTFDFECRLTPNDESNDANVDSIDTYQVEDVDAEINSPPGQSSKTGPKTGPKTGAKTAASGASRARDVCRNLILNDLNIPSNYLDSAADTRWYNKPAQTTCRHTLQGTGWHRFSLVSTDPNNSHAWKTRYHGTKHSVCRSIVKNGLVIGGHDNIKIAHGAAMGNGVYCTSYLPIAAAYASKQESGSSIRNPINYKSMFQCRIKPNSHRKLDSYQNYNLNGHSASVVFSSKNIIPCAILIKLG